jgi:hypothetical protein
MDFYDPVKENVSHLTVDLFLSSHWISKWLVFLVSFSYIGNNVNHEWLEVWSYLIRLVLNRARFVLVLDISKDLFCLPMRMVILNLGLVITEVFLVELLDLTCLLTIESSSHLLIQI